MWGRTAVCIRSNKKKKTEKKKALNGNESIFDWNLFDPRRSICTRLDETKFRATYIPVHVNQEATKFDHGVRAPVSIRFLANPTREYRARQFHRRTINSEKKSNNPPTLKFYEANCSRTFLFLFLGKNMAKDQNPICDTKSMVRIHQ